MHEAAKTRVPVTHPLDTLVSPSNAHIKVSVVGLGFVGLPLALSFAMRGCRVTGLDISRTRVEQLAAGIAPDAEAYLGFGITEILDLQLSSGRFRPTTVAAEALADAGLVLITVGIPVDREQPVLDHLIAATRTVAQHLRPGQTVILRSTVIPGTSERVVLPILEESGLKAGRDFFLAYASERIAEGRAFEEFEEMPIVVAGVNPESASRARALLSVVTQAEIHQSDSMAAVEAAKVIENVQRDVNIALVQEMARFCEAASLDTYDVIRLANTHKRVNLLSPGPGVGGYCIPNALYYLLPAAQELGVDLRLMRTARVLNDAVPDVVVRLVGSTLAQVKVALAGSRIAVLGLAMKDYSSDARSSPAIAVVDRLQAAGAEVRAFDPLVPGTYPYRSPDLATCLTGADAAVWLARQAGAEFSDVLSLLDRMAHPVIIDTKGAVNLMAAKEHGIILGRL